LTSAPTEANRFVKACEFQRGQLFRLNATMRNAIRVLSILGMGFGLFVFCKYNVGVFELLLFATAAICFTIVVAADDIIRAIREIDLYEAFTETRRAAEEGKKGK
jgi:hypothetical protein